MQRAEEKRRRARANARADARKTARRETIEEILELVEGGREILRAKNREVRGAEGLRGETMTRAREIRLARLGGGAEAMGQLAARIRERIER